MNPLSLGLGRQPPSLFPVGLFPGTRKVKSQTLEKDAHRVVHQTQAFFVARSYDHHIFAGSEFFSESLHIFEEMEPLKPRKVLLVAVLSKAYSEPDQSKLALPSYTVLLNKLFFFRRLYDNGKSYQQLFCYDFETNIETAQTEGSRIMESERFLKVIFNR